MNIAVIPARGGSKRIPRKNIKLFGGQPMISYAIKAAEKSKLFDHVLVSTDDAEIIEIANHFGAETPFVRSAELATDYADTASVIAHAIQSCEKLGWNFSNVCCIYPCVPFIEVEDLQGSYVCLETGDVDYCFPVTEFQSAVQRALKRNADGFMKPFNPEFEFVRTQDLEPAYQDAGQFYWGKKEAWLTNPRIHSNGKGYLIPSWRVVDVDTPEDWGRAEQLALVLKKY